MAHYAILDADNSVTQVVVGRDETDTHNDQPMDWEAYYGGKRTSYNTRGGVYYLPDVTPGNQAKAYRKNFAGIGFTYDPVRDAFVPPKPYPSWVLDESSCLWQAPVPYPDDGQMYRWDEETGAWIAVEGTP